MDFDLAKDIFIVIASAIAGGAVQRLFERRPRLTVYYLHTSAFRFPDGNVIYSHAIVVTNTGRKAATAVRIRHHNAAMFYIYPEVKHDREELPGGGFIILVDRLVPRQQLTIQYMYSPPLTFSQINTTVDHSDGVAAVLAVLPVQVQPLWKLRTATTMMILGAGAMLYLAITGAKVLFGLFRGS